MAERYRIELQGRINVDWSGWLYDFELTYTRTGNTILTGEVADQAALHGLLTRIRDLGIPILLVARIPPADSSHDHQHLTEH